MLARSLRRLIARRPSAPARTRWSTTRRALVGVVVLVLVSACGGGTSSAGKAALRGLGGLGDEAGASADDILRQQRQLRSLSDDVFSNADLERRATLLASSDAWLARAVVTEVDRTVAAAVAEAAASAEQVAAQSALSGDRTFLQDLSEVTKDVLIGQACGVVLDQLAPDERPEQPGKGSKWEEPAQEAVDKLVAARWPFAFVRAAVQWTYYSRSVVKDGEQVAAALSDDPGAYVQFAASPAVSRAAVVYLRTCYDPPRPFAPRGR